MYAKIVTLLALFLGSLSGVATASQSAIGHNETDRAKPVETVQSHISHETMDENRPHTEGDDPSRRERPAEEDPEESPLLGCHTTDGTPNAEVTSFAAQLGLTYESVLSWYCTGYSFETIQVVYDMSVLAGVSVDQIYEMRVGEGYTWDQIIEALGITFSRGTPPMILDEADRPRSDK